jgi:hypothetical protein
MDASAFESACSAAADATYAQFGVAAVYTANGEDPVDVRVLVDSRSRDTRDKQGSRSKVHTLRGSVRVSQVEELGRGDTIQLSGESILFRVVPASVTNDGLEWDFEATAEITTTVGNVQTFPDR